MLRYQHSLRGSLFSRIARYVAQGTCATLFIRRSLSPLARTASLSSRCATTPWALTGSHDAPSPRSASWPRRHSRRGRPEHLDGQPRRRRRRPWASAAPGPAGPPTSHRRRCRGCAGRRCRGIRDVAKIPDGIPHPLLNGKGVAGIPDLDPKPLHRPIPLNLLQGQGHRSTQPGEQHWLAGGAQKVAGAGVAQPLQLSGRGSRSSKDTRASPRQLRPPAAAAGVAAGLTPIRATSSTRPCRIALARQLRLENGCAVGPLPLSPRSADSG